MAYDDNQVHNIHKELCRELNMDLLAKNYSWQQYSSIANIYTLEGDPTQWLCCALYVACRNSVVPTVEKSAVVEGNCVSLTRLLRLCNLSLYIFFQRMKTWIEMASLSPEFRLRVDRLERSFKTSLCIYQKYATVFEYLFNCPPIDELKPGKGKKVKPTPCTPNKVYELCWLLFVCVKGECPTDSVDLVSSFHLLLCCADLIFANAIDDNRKDLINSSFPGLPADWNKPNFDPSSHRPYCIMAKLCEEYNGGYVDAMHTKEYKWKNPIEKFFQKNILKGDKSSLMGIIQIGNFEHNLKTLNSSYETYVLSCGEIDERIFLEQFKYGTKNSRDNLNPENQLEINESIRLDPHTPITRRNYLQHHGEFLTPVNAATQSVTRLHTMLGNKHDGQAPPSLKLLFDLCNNDPAQRIANRLNEMKQIFIAKYITDDAIKRFQLAEKLYYRLLENITRCEMKNNANVIQQLMDEDLYHKTLIVCSIEIVLCAYKSSNIFSFPWILDCFNLEPYYFTKIIEVVVKNHQTLLTSLIIKHLNTIEEQAIESLSWKNTSPLWDKINELDGKLPSYSEVNINKRHDINGVAPNLQQLQIKNNGTNNVLPSLINENNNNNNDNLINNLISTPTNNNQNNNNIRRPHRSLKIFLRKFYKLAFNRLVELCQLIELLSQEQLKKIWTIFEHTIIEHYELMKDRHLDQIIMCAIYVLVRVSRNNITFVDIMRYYRQQPQAASHVYRNVFIDYVDVTNNTDGQATPSTTTAGTTANEQLRSITDNNNPIASTSQTDHEINKSENRDDIIAFYNKIFVPKIQDFAMRFSSSNSQQVEVLAPLPNEFIPPFSPYKISDSHSIFVMPMEARSFIDSPNPIVYEFSSSPPQDLKRINRVVSESSSVKRKLCDDDTNDSITTTVHPHIKQRQNIGYKLQKLITDREENIN